MSGAVDRFRTVSSPHGVSGDVKDRKTAKRAAPLSVRLSDAERDLLVERAQGLPLSTYLKACALDGDASEQGSPEVRGVRGSSRSVRKALRHQTLIEDRQLLAELLARLGGSRLSQNLNQIAKAAHLGVIRVDDELRHDLAQACVDVAWMRTMLAQALGVKAGSHSSKDRS